jgi:hypothetical protein
LHPNDDIRGLWVFFPSLCSRILAIDLAGRIVPLLVSGTAVQLVSVSHVIRYISKKGNILTLCPSRPPSFARLARPSSPWRGHVQSYWLAISVLHVMILLGQATFVVPGAGEGSGVLICDA